MLQKLLNKLEDPNIPLLGPNVFGLKFWGILLPNRPLSRYLYIFLHIVLIFFVLSEWIDVWYIKHNVDLLFNNLKITLVATVSVSKLCSMMYYQKKWIDIIDYVTKSDINQRRDNDPIKKKIIDKYTNYCRTITYFYFALTYTTVVFIIIQPLLKYIFSESYRTNVKNGDENDLQVVSSWVPFNKYTPLGRISACSWQTFAAFCGGGWLASIDTTAIVTMVFFKGELELLKYESSDIFNKNYNNKDNLKIYYRRHVELIKHCRDFDLCLSPIMFLYIIVCSVMFCATAYQLNTESSILHSFIIAEYLIFAVSQLFMYCWHGNEVYYMSQDLMRGPYESTWWGRSVSDQKDILILVHQFNKNILFSAGPFVNLTIEMFVGILKAAYSYYTLLSK